MSRLRDNKDVRIRDGRNDTLISQKHSCMKSLEGHNCCEILKNQPAISSMMHSNTTDSRSKAPAFIQLLSSHVNHINNYRSLVIAFLLVNCNCFVTSQTSSPTVVQTPPSVSPSPSPYVSSTIKPSFIGPISPAISPTTNPTRTIQPTDSPPSTNPSETYSPSKSKLPSYSPSVSPSHLPTRSHLPTNSPTNYPSEGPTQSVEPSVGPSDTFLPTIVPTQSPKPSPAPSIAPTLTPRPTGKPTVEPSMQPSKVPSVEPSAFPTYSVVFKEEVTIDQRFNLNITDENWPGWNFTEVEIFESVMAGYTVNISGPADTSQINFTCTLETQQPGILPGVGVLNQVRYVLHWTSVYVNISGYAYNYPAFINKNLEAVTADLQEIKVSKATDAITAIEKEFPSYSPTGIPSGISSVPPTAIPSSNPSVFPSTVPTLYPSSSNIPSEFPSAISDSPSYRPSSPPGGPTSTNGGATTAIVAVIVTLGALILVGLFFFYRRRRRRKEMVFQEAAAGSNGLTASGDGENTQLSSLKVLTDPVSSANWNDNTPRSDDNAVAGMISPSDSLLSNQSLLSPGDSMGDFSVEEADGTHHLADEFDQYKDQNLEKMRADVEESLTGSDGMMSQAMTKALMADEDPVADQSDLFWGGSGDPAEIEASALCEVNDWLKRKEGANLEERRGFMQDTMNKMVASVRHGVMKPDEAARTIHECAALLGLELASDIAEDTVIVTGLRKNVTKSDLELTFREFGEIDEAAVASNSRGFGIVRFVSRTSAQETMKRFRLGEIVVQDVAVTVKLLKSQGTSFGTTTSDS